MVSDHIPLTAEHAAALNAAVNDLVEEGIRVPGKIGEPEGAHENASPDFKSGVESPWVFAVNPAPILETIISGDVILLRGEHRHFGMEFTVHARVSSVDGLLIQAVCIGCRNSSGQWADGAQGTTLGLGEPKAGDEIRCRISQIAGIQVQQSNSHHAASVEVENLVVRNTAKGRK